MSATSDATTAQAPHQHATHKQEKDDPSIIKGKRIERIAAGAGVSGSDVRDLLKQHQQSKKMMGSIGKDRKMRKKMMKQFAGTNMDALTDSE